MKKAYNNLRLTKNLARDSQTYTLLTKTILKNHHWKNQKNTPCLKECDRKEFNITLNSLNNIIDSQEHIKNIIEPSIYFDKYIVALIHFSYPCEIKLKFCTIELIKAELKTNIVKLTFWIA